MCTYKYMYAHTFSHIRKENIPRNNTEKKRIKTVNRCAVISDYLIIFCILIFYTENVLYNQKIFNFLNF